MAKLTDEIVGELEYDSGWCKNVSLMFFREVCSVQLAFAADEDEALEPIQRNAYSAFWRLQGQLLQAAESAIFSYYQSIRSDLVLRVPIDSIDIIAPFINESVELKKVVRLGTLFFPEGFRNKRRITGLLLDCKWDPALGLAVRFEDEEIVEVGPQDIVL